MNNTLKNVGVVIVNYCTPDLTTTCVKSLRKWHIADDSQIIVVDNASPDDSYSRLRHELPGIKIINAGRNGGFSFGINAGARELSSQYLLVLNPDTYFVDDSLKFALEIFDLQPNVGLVGLNLIYPDGRQQFSARRFYSVLDILARRIPVGRYLFFRKRLEKHMMVSAWKNNESFEADWVMGTGFIIRRDLFWQIGGMDESYFLYMEDVDLCARVWASGSRVMCVPTARLVHQHQRSSASNFLSRTGREHIRSFLIFMRHYKVPMLTPPYPNTIRRKN
jgi:GT2 family glycosyltransferase